MPVGPAGTGLAGPPTNTFAGSVPVFSDGIVVCPPASGQYANPGRNTSRLPRYWVSMTYRPAEVASSASAPTPRGCRPGFQASGTPVRGSCAEMPGRGTAPAEA